MILQRLVASLRRRDWFTVVTEIGIVVLGVFIGIEVSNWNEDRQNRAAAGLYMERLEVDIEMQLSMWENALVGPADDLDEGFLIALYQASQGRRDMK